MPEIKCPNCGEVFTIDESKYQKIVNDIRTQEFNDELNARLAKEHELAKAQSAQAAVELEAKKNAEIAKLQSQIKELQGEAVTAKAQKQLEINQAVAASEKKVSELEAELKGEKARQELAVAQAVAAQKDVMAKKDAEITQLKGDAKNAEFQKELSEKNLKEGYEAKLKVKEEELAYYKDLKTKMSTKMIGETLEQHCEMSFENVRPAGFQNAYFKKDNDESEGSKGDYIFRDYTDDGIELVSIMFEMKNEMDTTSTKHKNEDFFKKLDDDRRKKNCEYAVLVTMLEADNEWYNQGIVDVSYRSGYEKMYVIRPQFFIPFITMIRNMAVKSADAKRELAIVRQQNVDVTTFEDKVNAIRDGFAKQYGYASDNFDKAVKEIDETIKHLQKVKDDLLLSTKQLGLANGKLEDLSVKKLTRNNPTMKAKFEEAAKAKENIVDHQED